MPEYQVLVTVLPRPELLDPEGDTITQAIHRIGEPRVKTVRAGRAFELHIQAPTPEEASAIAHTLAQKLLHNPVVEVVAIHIATTSAKEV
ncbi:MAG: phosphoribosylformylglycinamidine synthase subunit PurS [Bacteroidia bacterium]|jgi:phosphoribosylformylglycinamidine synthase|nr:phosphoribosylformylglycinamidine synthase subunit PurS [Bacteroidia bacterium]GIV24195.1 MAG: phosphoribosylformylglycinamidine synthase subunit PurS [Bacteroidia bacterium]